MIYIKEDKPTKMPGMTSLYIKFNYNAELVDYIKYYSAVYSYDKKTYTWEVPVTSLANLLDVFSTVDDVRLEVASDSIEYENAFNVQLNVNHYKTKPFEYQLDAIKFGLMHDKWLLLDAPGLGKTLTLIYLAQELKERENIEHCLVICGINTLKHNWKNEIAKHSDLTCRILGQRTRKKSGKEYIGGVKERLEDLKNPIDEFFVITNIETLRNKDIIKEINKGKNNFNIIYVDEIHTCKSSSSAQGANLLKLNNAKYMVGATGTLLVNSPVDSYVPLKWLGVEHANKSTFENYYCLFGGPFGHDLLGYRNLSILQDELNNHSLRRTKDILDLPPKNIIHEYVDMDDEQANFYENIKNGVIEEADKIELKPNAVLSLFGRLRQATACPSILTTQNISSSKIDRACDLVEQICSNNEKVVIFSIYKETLNVLFDKLKQYKPLICTGDISDVIINENIKKFQEDDEHMIMLATTWKMGTGITLTRASYEIFIDCTWTQAQNEQCEDRCHRIGSKDPVFIYYLWTNNTADLHVKEIVENKGLISNYVVDNECPPALADKLKNIIVDMKEHG